mmetsp:Transcript_23699/g.39666  ORF Transcript_23699/g.39666 Transcript_23699/m.39666 type:complete len:172 (+) Transcript_23699:1046-1561(+)
MPPANNPATPPLHVNFRAGKRTHIELDSSFQSKESALSLLSGQPQAQAPGAGGTPDRDKVDRIRAELRRRLNFQEEGDRKTAYHIDYKTPFASADDAVRRLLVFHTLYEPVLAPHHMDRAEEEWVEKVNTQANTFLSRLEDLEQRYKQRLEQDSQISSSPEASFIVNLMSS